jgi:DNA-binding response OmpR family regulator
VHTQRTLRVLVAVRDVEESDRLAGELAEIGFETAAVFSGPEAIGALHVESFDALVIDASLEEGAHQGA